NPLDGHRGSKPVFSRPSLQLAGDQDLGKAQQRWTRFHVPYQLLDLFAELARLAKRGHVEDQEKDAVCLAVHRCVEIMTTAGPGETAGKCVDQHCKTKALVPPEGQEGTARWAVEVGGVCRGPALGVDQPPFG